MRENHDVLFFLKPNLSEFVFILMTLFDHARESHAKKYRSPYFFFTPMVNKYFFKNIK